MCFLCVALANPEYALDAQFTLEKKALLDAVFDESDTEVDAVGGPPPVKAQLVRMSGKINEWIDEWMDGYVF